MKNIVENSANYWHFVVAVLISLEVLNQKIFIFMMESVHSVILSCVIISTLFIYLGGLITYLISIYLEDKSNTNQEFLKRMDCLESNMQEVQGSLNEKITELRNLMHNDLGVKHQDLVERMVNQNILVESNQTAVIHNFNQQSELANKNREEVINSLLSIKILSKENTAELVSNIKGFEDKQQGTLEAINKQIEDVAFETRNEVSNMLSSYDDKTQQRFGSVAVALEDATSNIVDRVIEEASKTGEVIMGVRKSILIELEAESNLAQTNQEAIMESFARQAEVAGKNKEELVAGLLLLEKLAKENKAELANSIVGFENKQQEAIEAVGKQIEETAVETKASVIETVSVCEEQLKQKLEEANAVIIGKVSEEGNKVGAAVEETKKVIVARIEAESNLAQTNQEAIMESFGRQAEVAGKNKEELVAGLLLLEKLAKENKAELANSIVGFENKQQEAIEAVGKQIEETAVETKASVIETVSVCEEQLKQKLEEANAVIIGKVSEEGNKVGAAVEETKKVIVARIEAESNLAQTNQEAIMESFGRQAEVTGKNKEELVAGLLLLEKLAKENKAELANSIVGFENKQQEAIEAVGKQIEEAMVKTKGELANGINSLVKKENVTFDNMNKRIDVLEALINNSRIDLHNQFELLKKEQNDTFVIVLEQIEQMNIAARDTIANEIAKLSVIEEILADEFEEVEEQEPKYDVTKPPIEVGDKYKVKKKNPNRTETIVDEKLGSKLNNTYKNDKLVLSQILTKGKVTYEVKYDDKERPKWSCTYDENHKPSIEIEYYENGQVKRRTQFVVQNGTTLKQITNFDINGNKI